MCNRSSDRSRPARLPYLEEPGKDEGRVPGGDLKLPPEDSLGVIPEGLDELSGEEGCPLRPHLLEKIIVEKCN
jgi:hypothetical protein